MESELVLSLLFHRRRLLALGCTVCQPLLGLTDLLLVVTSGEEVVASCCVSAGDVSFFYLLLAVRSTAGRTFKGALTVVDILVLLHCHAGTVAV